MSFLLVASVLFLSSCATIVSGSKEYVAVSSKPSVARVYIDGVKVGKTPFETLLKRNREHFLTIKLPGYKPYKTVLRRKYNLWILGNVFTGSLFGLVVDLATGAIYRLTPEQMLGQAGYMRYIEQGRKVTLSVELHPIKGGEKIGQLERQQ